jgi:hypothetical protein
MELSQTAMRCIDTAKVYALRNGIITVYQEWVQTAKGDFVCAYAIVWKPMAVSITNTGAK